MQRVSTEHEDVAASASGLEGRSRSLSSGSGSSPTRSGKALVVKGPNTVKDERHWIDTMERLGYCMSNFRVTLHRLTVDDIQKATNTKREQLHHMRYPRQASSKVVATPSRTEGQDENELFHKDPKEQALDRLERADNSAKLLEALGLKRNDLQIEVSKLDSAASTFKGKELSCSPQGTRSPSITSGHSKSNTPQSDKTFSRRCYCCLKMFGNVKEFKAHRRLHTESHLSHNNCPICAKVLGSYKKLSTHYETVHGEKQALKKKAPKASAVPFKLSILQQRKLAMKQFTPPKVLKPQNPPRPSQRSVSAPNGLSSPMKWNDGRVTITHLPGAQTDINDVYPPHFMESFMELDGPREENDEDNEDIQIMPTSDSFGIDKLGSEIQITPHVTATYQNGLMVRPYNHDAGSAVTTTSFNNFMNISSSASHMRIPTLEFPRITTGLALPTVTTVALARPKCIPSSSPPAPGAGVCGAAPQTPPRLPDTTITVGSAGDYKSYKELLEPVNMIKKFAVDKADGSILFTLLELEKHIMMKIFADSNGGVGIPLGSSMPESTAADLQPALS